MASSPDVETPLRQQAAESFETANSFEVSAQGDAGTSGVRVFFLVAILAWQAWALGQHAPSLSALLVSGDHDYLNASCANVFWALQWSFRLSLIMLLLNLALGAINLLSCLDGLRDLVKLGKFCTGCGEVFIAISGIVVINFKVQLNEAHACPELYHCAWWCFIGFVFLPVLVVCISCFFLAGYATGTADAQAAADAPDGSWWTFLRPSTGGPPTYGAAPPGQQDRHPGLQVFAGQPHRLGEEAPAPPEAPIKVEAAAAAAEASAPARPEALANVGAAAAVEAPARPEALANVGAAAAVEAPAQAPA
eukprot:CAMPEP_0171066838 /NCGR_PEP_ID=MMETSP0766_2-20121228/7649_1 /TAXON_ID=439317 /ORGANISM="Gambierdiscus australes, Strain CAWD 149" /LENGTH=306 /DNA_ID=CAMNT_0011523029 /DNA_START=29 /DNA_END=949 /DNA_ORIENTATION=-